MGQPVSGHVTRVEGKRRPVWRAKYRRPDGRQVKRTLGPAWTYRGRPPAGYFTKRTAEAWLRRTLAEAAAGTLPGMHIDPHRRLANRTREKSITVFHGVMERARKLYRLPANPVADIEKPRFPGSAIRVRASWTNGHLTSPKSGRVRSVPMAPQVAEAVARLSQREFLIDDDDVVFAGITGGYLDGSALSKRYRAALQRAALRPLRFHDLRHTFGTRVIGVADIRRVQEWMGHANVQTTMQYLHSVHARKTPRSSMRRSQRILHAVTTRLNRHSMPLVRAVSSESAFGCSCRFSRTTAPSAREPRPAPGSNG